VVNLASDWGTNIALGTGIGSLQAIQAAQFYLDIKNAYPGANITFTGHSLGGGLASIMAVWFDRPAVVFDAAPFELGALNVAQILPFIGQDAALAQFQVLPIPTLQLREHQVTDYAVKGEALESIRFIPTVIEGTNIPIFAGGSNQVGAIDLHSMNLLAALMISPQLKRDTDLLPNLLKLFFDPTAHGYDPNTGNRDFKAFLLNDQVAKGYDDPDGLLNRFAADLERMAAGALDRTTPDVDLVTRLAIDYYYRMENGFTGVDLFTRTVGGAQFDLAKFNCAPVRHHDLLGRKGA
jgi:hypothetical protein